MHQKQELEAWLSPRFSPEHVNLRFISSLVLFAESVTFAPDVEAALNSATQSFQAAQRTYGPAPPPAPAGHARN
ncbi:hypothetical protein ACFQT0_14150 [Hymenobacter humi]|uniref:Uncharacterized protein n=1 Tax=Hymenobacter humi TaxID=1411620 RepID=A0ABW2U7Q2_9BACT